MNIALKVCYDGTHFCGWQVQNNGRTVQGELEAALQRRFGFFARITGSGRTDAGVHAAGQVCNFAMAEGIKISPSRIADALNTVLPGDVKVLQSAAVPESFDACRTAKKKTYRYRVYFSPQEVPLLERYAVRAEGKYDLQKMRLCARLLEGEHDFSAFSATGSSVRTTVRTLYFLRPEEREEYGVPVLEIDVCGNGFLYNMVRILAGTLLACGCGKISQDAISRALESGDRELLGKTMPAKGLILLRAEYDADPFGDAAL